jgi:hypothetical protein
MTPEQIEQERAAFEAWLATEGITTGLEQILKKKEDGCYASRLMGAMFQAWLARAERAGGKA